MPGETMPEQKKAPDWDRIEIDYRAGIKTLREIADEHGITHGAINKRAKRDGWVRDLAEKIRAKAKEKVSKSEVSKEVSSERLATEREIIEVESEVQARIEIAHRRDITKARSLAMSLLDELGHQVANPELYERLGELLRKEDDKGVDRLNDIYHKVVGFGGRSTNMKQLADTLKVLVDLERKVYGIESRAATGGGLEELLGKLDE
jgi:hypothetical protein